MAFLLESVHSSDAGCEILSIRGPIDTREDRERGRAIWANRARREKIE
jgi:hypothetical protein